MKHTFAYISSALLVASLILVTSCKEKFSEEDALKAQQEVDLAIYVTNQTDPAQPPVAGANVTVTISGKTTSVTTDAAGAALFPKIQVGTYVYKVEAASFITAAGTGSANPSNFRQKQVTQQVNLISLADADLATVKGTITMEKDVTNLTKEGASGVDVYFNVYLNIGQRVFTTKTDANGNYQIKLPTNGVNQQTYVEILYADIEADQVIAVNKFSDEVGSFPQILPRKETLKTVFSVSANFTNNFGFSSNNVRSVFAVVDAPPATGTQAVVSTVFTDASGRVTGVSFSNGGNYTGDADGFVNIAITSLDGGSGASIRVALAGNSSVSTAYGTPANVTITAGSGYPANSNNFTLNKTGSVAASYQSYTYIQKGTVSIANGDYGTGVSRPKQVQ